MFGEYAQIATYLPSARDTAGDYPATNLPPHLLPPPPISQPLWAPAGLGRRGRGTDSADDKSSLEDFVMVAEFSEIEGPKPVLTIPKDAGGNIDQNQLSVKLMAVDHQTSSEGFSISEDTQVVLSDDESGVSAFVHHFVLYDNQARGFVRPYCMVFISADIRKILMFYEELSAQFKRAARFLKYGNRLLFVKDLERHLQDLEHTKGYLLNQVSRMRLKDNEGPDSEQSKSRTNAENELYKGLQNIRQSTTEIRDILTILKPLLHDRRLECRFRALEDRAFQCGSEQPAHADKLSLQEDWFADNLYSEGTQLGPSSGGSLKESNFPPVSLFKSAPSHTPLLVETKKAKRFNSPLRGLHELCSWGAKEGLRKLRCIHEYFKKDAMVLEIERNEIRLMEPSNSMIIHGHCITSNVVAGVSLRGSSLCLSEDSSSNILSADRLKRWPSITSNDTLESFKSVDSFLSLQDEEDESLFSFASGSSPCITTSASAQDFMSAPTSPMTEEVVFPPVVSPQSKPPNNTTTTAGSTPPPPLTLTTSSSHTASISLSPPAAENTDLEVSCSQATVHATEGGALVGHLQQFCPPHPQNFPSSLSSVASPYSSTVDSPPVQPVTHNADSYGAATQDNAQADLDTADSTLTNPTGADLSNHSSCDDGQVVVVSQDQQVKPALSLQTEDQTTGGASGRKGSEGSSRILEIFQQQALVDGHDLSRTSESLDSQTTSETAGPLSKPLNNGSICRQSGGSDVSSNSRTPSFVPLLAPNPGQSIRATRRQKSADHSSSSSPEKCADLDRWRLELSDSCSIGQTDGLLCGAHAEGGYCDIENTADIGCNMFSAFTPSSDSCLWKPRNGVYTAGDVTNSLAPGRPGYGIHEVLCSYSHLQPVLFSLMTGRTVLVVGLAKMEVEVTKIVTALSIFLPDTKRKQHCVVDWMNRPLKVTDLTRLRLAGICRSEKRSLDATIPLAVKQYSTVMDVERRVIIGPNYQGSLLNCVLQQKKCFKTDAQHVAFIHSWLMEISNKAFIFYHSFCLGEAGGLTHSHNVEKHREQYNATICCLMNRLGVRDHDITIVEYLAEKVKLSQLEPHIWAGVDKGAIVHPLSVSSRGNYSFRC